MTACCAYNGNSFQFQLTGFRALEDVQLLDCRNLVKQAQLQRCFENNNINSLSVTNIGNVNLFEQRLIDGLFNSVESLSLEYSSQTDFSQLMRLTKLKKLRLHCQVRCDVEKCLPNINPDIEQLEVKNIFITKSMLQALKTFTKLRRLSFEDGSVSSEFFKILPTVSPNLEQLIYTYNVVNDDDFIHMFKLMPKLKHLSLFGCNLLANKTYVEMVEILTKDSKRPKLKFIPPQLESLKSFKILENVKRVMF